MTITIPLDVKSFSIKGYKHGLTARFTEPATYYLVYGNPTLGKPQYDIARFTDKNPAAPSQIKLGDEQTLAKAKTNGIAPLFENKIWLWGIMLVVNCSNWLDNIGNVAQEIRNG